MVLHEATFLYVRSQDGSSNSDGLFQIDEEQNCRDFQFYGSPKELVFTYKRALDTCNDQEDYVIEV